MRDRSLFAVVMALVAGVFFWPGASRHGEEEQSAASLAAVARSEFAAPAQSAKASAGTHAEATPHEAGRHGGAHPHVSGAMLLLLAEYLALDPHPEVDLLDGQVERLSREIGQAVEAGGVTVEPLIATLPDPIESHAKWMFDRYLDGLSRGIIASGYVMDRFGPEAWWTSTNPHTSAEPATAAAASDGTAATQPIHHHEGEPGVVLFRSTDGKRLLVLLIVTETATAGVNSHATMTALDSAANLLTLRRQPGGDAGSSRSGAGPDASCTPAADRTLKLVGPTFSGSAVSLRTAVERWLMLRTDGCWGLRIVSGSISSVISRNTLGEWDKRVTFRATVPADDALQEALFTYLKTLNGGRGERVAWIVEDNTTFGASFKPALAKSSPPRALNAAAAQIASASAEFQRIVIPFPMHVSRLYSAAADERAQAQARSKSLFAPQNIMPLRLGDSGSPRDAFPPMTPELTFASVEMALTSLLDNIHSERIRLVAIMATDTRDKLFLAEQIARRVPDALLFTTTSDILYLHPDVNDNVRGMLIASAYPLNPVAQAWTPHDEYRVLQLQHNSAQSIYNATLALLGPPGADPSVSNTVAPLLDYGAPGPISTAEDETTGPAIWISSVGRDTFWPVAIFDTRDTRLPPDARLIKVRTSREPRHPSPLPVPDLELSPWASALFVALAVLVMLHVGVYALAGPRGRERRRRDPTRALSGPASLHWLTRSFRPSSESPVDAIANPTAATADTAPAAALRQDATAQTDAPIVWNDCNTSHRRAPVTVYQLICVAALWTFFTLPVTLSVIWLKAALEMRAIDPQTPTAAIVIGWSAALVASVAWIGLTALAGALAWTTIQRIAPRWRTLWREARGWPTTVRLVLWLIGIAAIVETSVDVLRHMPVTQTGLWAQLPYFMRVTTLGNGLSPVVTYFLVTATFYAWGLMNLRRLATPTPMLCISLPESARPRDWRVPLLRRLGFPDPEGVIEKFQCRSTDVFLAVPAAGPLVAFASAIVIYVIVLGPPPLTIEGPTFGTAIMLSMIILHVITGLAVFQFYLLWRTLHAFLEQLAQDGLLDAFESLGKRHVRVISAGISLRGPRDIDVYLAEHSTALVHASTPETDKALPPAASETTPAPAAVTVTTGAPTREGVPPVVLDFLMQRAAASEAPREDITIATLMAFAIQQILTRIGELLAFATISTALVISAFATFPFGRGPVLDGFGWLYVFILAGTALIVFIQVARDPILGRLKGYEKPGALNWDRDLITKVALYAGVPLFGFISSQFPWLGRVLAQWLQPVQQALPWH